jgi:hypothetical protein
MDEILVDLSQGDKDELALLNPGMRDLELFRVYFNIIEEEDIQINRPGTPSEGFRATQERFDAL